MPTPRTMDKARLKWSRKGNLGVATRKRMNAVKQTVVPSPEAWGPLLAIISEEPWVRNLLLEYYITNWPGSLCFTRAIWYLKTCPMFPHLPVSRETSQDSPVFLAWLFIDSSPSWFSFPGCWVVSNTKTWYPDLNEAPDQPKCPWVTHALAIALTTMHFWLTVSFGQCRSVHELSLSQGFFILHSCSWFFEPNEMNFSLLNPSL